MVGYNPENRINHYSFEGEFAKDEIRRLEEQIRRIETEKHILQKRLNEKQQIASEAIGAVKSYQSERLQWALDREWYRKMILITTATTIIATVLSIIALVQLKLNSNSILERERRSPLPAERAGKGNR